mmetsp:Transcript_10345/g.16867  ORF Transcript_10345/g.16867 Transcript_10345/m.16867 type:complete len:376 (-) Transcript_10345:1177-2304(-)|eukprot:CAMPEP_0184656984 /NCGR_PEP_ID=MMETSP0308-20130426/16884_1 /TAXON_ID=38269 /ORGANISM="Gloeochaete witrockiana, Strain SAG 46.84" /LENGTH=375 /DNA_ID=CAMNT_0027094329 /DNA_START=184 /DNA_END=1311 /DNA_ORIENTATION=+
MTVRMLPSLRSAVIAAILLISIASLCFSEASSEPLDDSFSEESSFFADAEDRASSSESDASQSLLDDNSLASLEGDLQAIILEESSSYVFPREQGTTSSSSEKPTSVADDSLDASAKDAGVETEAEDYFKNVAFELEEEEPTTGLDDESPGTSSQTSADSGRKGAAQQAGSSLLVGEDSVLQHPKQQKSDADLTTTESKSAEGPNRVLLEDDLSDVSDDAAQVSYSEPQPDADADDTAEGKSTGLAASSSDLELLKDIKEWERLVASEGAHIWNKKKKETGGRALKSVMSIVSEDDTLATLYAMDRPASAPNSVSLVAIVIGVAALVAIVSSTAFILVNRSKFKDVAICLSSGAREHISSLSRRRSIVADVCDEV